MCFSEKPNFRFSTVLDASVINSHPILIDDIYKFLVVVLLSLKKRQSFGQKCIVDLRIKEIKK